MVDPVGYELPVLLTSTDVPIDPSNFCYHVQFQPRVQRLLAEGRLYGTPPNLARSLTRQS